ncbi:helix-turn-helix transcriptional regulator [Aneurinibacillus sp. BA2021]|nr:helix-turn-helix transcriptional regulator [Aneurinibacillus sp. BA2021]
MEKIHIKIGRNLQRLRKARGLSLDKTAEITGVSKAMLGQIERGESNPTVTTVWKIASGLRVSFSSLIEEESEAVSVIKRNEITPITEDGGRYQVYPLFPYDQEKRFEIYTVVLAPGCVHHSEAHTAGVQEYLTVEEGTLRLILQDTEYRIVKGNAIRFAADAPHTYENASDTEVRLHMLLYYPA